MKRTRAAESHCQKLDEELGNEDGEGIDQICFGMLIGLSFQLSTAFRETSELNEYWPLHLQVGSAELLQEGSPEVFGYLAARETKILGVLLREPQVSLQSYAVSSKTGSKSKSQQRKLELRVVLYGPSAIADKIGIFTSKCGLFLQHPQRCDRDVDYRNPHCLTPTQGSKRLRTHNMADIHEADTVQPHLNPIDLFSDAGECFLRESEGSEALTTPLYRHQKQALTFLLQRESGWMMEQGYNDMWRKQVDTSGRTTFVNIVTGQHRIRPPADFKGGLLIDAPGLGKTLSIIALIAATKRNAILSSSVLSRGMTLLVVPKSLIQTWEQELQKHVKAKALSCFVYYGSQKSKLYESPTSYDLVITTYSVVHMDWKASLSESKSSNILHSLGWERLVLDESHIIRETGRSFAKSVCALDSVRRWCVTGTPIQNRLSDLFSLFKFLKCSPFDDRKIFNAHVTQPWRSRSDPNSLAKLKTLMNCLSLRRPKTIVQLPPRKDEIVYLEFNASERQQYDDMKRSTISQIDHAIEHVAGTTFVNALQWVSQLRLFCNHGLRTQHEVNSLLRISNANSVTSAPISKSVLDRLDSADFALCSNQTCSQGLCSDSTGEMNIHELDELGRKPNPVLCFSCSQGDEKEAESTKSSFSQPCAGPAIGLGLIGATTDTAPAKGSTKINALINSLTELPSGSKSVVFSSWTKTLDLIRPELEKKSIRSLRLDGTLTTSRRANVLRDFRENAGIRVLLATITCGGVGLDLTVASRAYIVEPQWNPMSESQALDRIHRLGQEKEVKTTCYIMRDSWEEQVLKLQQRKKELADITLSERMIDKEELTHKWLYCLKDLLG